MERTPKTFYKRPGTRRALHSGRTHPCLHSGYGKEVSVFYVFSVQLWTRLSPTSLRFGVSGSRDWLRYVCGAVATDKRMSRVEKHILQTSLVR